MTQHPPQPTGQPWGQVPAGEPPTPQDGVAAPRAWYKKKRFIIPAGVVALVIAIGATGDGDEPDTPQAAEATATIEATPDTEPTVDAAVEAAEAEKAEAERAKAEEEAERLEAERVAEEEAERAAAEEAERAAAEEAERVAAEAAAAEAAAAGTVSQQNAKRSAENYLDFTAFSRTGLIDQLEYEGFSTADATWAVDGVTVDWNEQAAKSAENYLEFTAFSRSGLVDQLLYEGFTPEQAEYGVSQTGL